MTTIKLQKTSASEIRIEPLVAWPTLRGIYKKSGEFFFSLAHLPYNLDKLIKCSFQVDLDPKLQGLNQLYRELRSLPDVGYMDERLYDFQRDGVKFLCFRLTKFGTGLLTDEMGLGKTVQSLIVAENLKRDGVINKLLVVCPKPVVGKWEKEIYKWAPSFHFVGVFSSRNKEAGGDFIDGSYDALVTNYSLLSFTNPLANVNKQLCIFDEIHYVKNPEARRTKEALKIAEGNLSIGMSGTIIKQGAMDICTILKIAGREQSEGVATFKAFYFDSYGPRMKLKKSKKKHLERRLSLVGIGRKLKEVSIQLPDKIEDTIEVEMGTHQGKIYDLLGHQTFMALVGSGDTDNVLTQFLRLRQATAGVYFVNEEEGDEREFAVENNAKLEALLSLIDSSPNEPWVVWCQFRPAVEGIAGVLKKYGKVHYIHGGVQVKDRNFSGLGRDYQFLVTTPLTSGIGIDLVEARRQVFFSPSFSDADTQQAIKRLHRLGQTKTVFIYHLMAKETIDNHVATLRDYKGQLNDDMIAALIAGKAEVCELSV